MMKRNLFSFYTFGLLLSITAVIVATGVSFSQEILTESVITDIFSRMINEEGRTYDLSVLKFHEGSYTGDNANQALVILFDHDQSHATGFTEVWLLEKNRRWEPLFKVTENDIADFTTTDINGDGILEVLVMTTGGNQGYFTIYHKLITLFGKEAREIYSVEGFDRTGWPVEGLNVVDHSISFSDRDSDGILEMTDTKLKDFYTKEEGSLLFSHQEEEVTHFGFIIDEEGNITGIEKRD
jgi:hypothetical protein